MKIRILLTIICALAYNCLFAQLEGTYYVYKYCVEEHNLTDTIYNHTRTFSFAKKENEPNKFVTYNMSKPFAIVAEMLTDSTFQISDHQCFELFEGEKYCYGNEKTGTIKDGHIDFGYYTGYKLQMLYCYYSGDKISDSVSIPKPQIIEQPKGEVVNIYDSMGRQICGKSIESLPAGMYILQYENGVTEKIVKQ